MAPAIAVNLAVSALLITTAVTASAYTNHTVGGGSGWFFNSTTNTSSTNYSAWAADQTFNLGDFLVFNTNSNQTVIQTYNLTNYQKCSIDDDSTDNDTFQYGGGNQQFGEALTIAVPLTIEGANYFFSDADDGVQCQRGMAFQIDVQHGSGLPPSLNQPPPPPYREPPGPDSADSPAGTPADSAPPPNDGAFVARANLRLGLFSSLALLSAWL